MLATIINLSDDDIMLFLAFAALLTLIPLCTSLISAKRDQNDSGKQSPSGNTPSSQSVHPTQVKEESETTNASKTKCIFCGHPVDEKQVFCGACGRRKD